jgi:serine/threonine protein kinase
MSDSLRGADSVFAQAIEITSPQERAAFVEQACAGAPEQRREVEKLVRDYFRAGDFLEKPVARIAATLDTPPRLEAPGTLIGPYKLLEQLGEGGMGTVFVAEQAAPVRRRVALKLIKPGMDTREVLACFDAERQALALMEHPHIAKVFDAGTTASGRPYFVMELVRGLPITDYCDQARLTPRRRLGLFVTVCQALQHAHQKGVIHRDIKPSNVLITLHDGTPVVKVIDFGLAKALHQRLTDKTVYTAFRQLVGTPLYMSPEQAEWSGLDVDTRSDVYSLGVMLYEILTGTTPFNKERLSKVNYDELRRIIREEEPPKPSTRLQTLDAGVLTTLSEQRGVEPKKLSQQLRGELDWIVMKALEKDRSRRYESVSSFAADVQCYLDDEPIQARRPTLAYWVAKWAHRHKPVVWSAGITLLLTMGILVGSTFAIADALEKEKQAHGLAEQQFRAAKEQEKLAKEQQALAERQRAEAVRLVRAQEDFRAALALALGPPDFLHFLNNWQDDEAKIEATHLAVRLVRNQEKELADKPYYWSELAGLYATLSDLLFESKRLTEAVEAQKQAVQTQVKRLKDFPSDEDCRFHLASAYFRLGHKLVAIGRANEASAAAYLQSLQEHWKLIEDHPLEVKYQTPLARLFLVIQGWPGAVAVFDTPGKNRQAEELFRDYGERLSKKIDSHPHQFGYHLALAALQLSRAYQKKRFGQGAEAEKSLTAAFRTYERVGVQLLDSVP